LIHIIDRFLIHGGKIILKGIAKAIGFLCVSFFGRFCAVFALKVVVMLVAGKGANGFLSPKF
jgi:hypothetical protein